MNPWFEEAPVTSSNSIAFVSSPSLNDFGNIISFIVTFSNILAKVGFVLSLKNINILIMTHLVLSFPVVRNGFTD